MDKHPINKKVPATAATATDTKETKSTPSIPQERENVKPIDFVKMLSIMLAGLTE